MTDIITKQLIEKNNSIAILTQVIYNHEWEISQAIKECELNLEQPDTLESVEFEQGYLACLRVFAELTQDMVVECAKANNY